jgi:hypothetical protein
VIASLYAAPSLPFDSGNRLPAFTAARKALLGRRAESTHMILPPLNP